VAADESGTVVLSSGRRVGVHRLADGPAGRTVVLCHPAGHGDLDPGPESTWVRGITLFGVDPLAAGPDPAGPEVGVAAGELAEVLDRLGGSPVGLAGWDTAGWIAVALVAGWPDLVDRLVVLGMPMPDPDPPWLPAGRPAAITARTLVLCGGKDPVAGPRHGRRWQKRLPNARLEVVPGAGHRLLVPMWERVLSHLAPRCRR
jgi:pimeloyl-ACP methyl ester carboxylesterase